MQFTSLILLILLLALMYFFLIRPQQKRAKEHREMISRAEVLAKELLQSVELKVQLKQLTKQQ